MPIQQEVWLNDLAENIYPDNSFVLKSKDETENVDYRTVHRPQEGGAPEVARNGTPPPPAGNNYQRTDEVLSYDVDYYRSRKTVVTNLEQKESSYDKRASVLGSHSKQLEKYTAAWTANLWAYKYDATNPVGQAIRTTGDPRAAMALGATGNRASITLDDILKAKSFLDDWDIALEGRVALLPSFMYNDLLKIPEVIDAMKADRYAMPTGVVGNLFGFEIMQRSTVLTYNNGTNLDKQNPFTSLGTGNAAALFWHPDFVAHAKGGLDIFVTEQDPDLYGDAFSAEVRVGASPVYKNGKGIVTLVEAAA